GSAVAVGEKVAGLVDGHAEFARLGSEQFSAEIHFDAKTGMHCREVAENVPVEMHQLGDLHLAVRHIKHADQCLNYPSRAVTLFCHCSTSVNERHTLRSLGRFSFPD